MHENTTAIRCVGGIAHDSHGRLLLVRRGRAPSEGLWSLPGGRVERGETDAAAVVRELAEETGLDVVPGALAGVVHRDPYLIYDYRCSVRGGRLRAADDAAEARWVSLDEFTGLDRAGELTIGLSAHLNGWNLLPAP